VTELFVVVSLRHCYGYLVRLLISIQDFAKGTKSEKVWKNKWYLYQYFV